VFVIGILFERQVGFIPKNHGLTSGRAISRIQKDGPPADILRGKTVLFHNLVHAEGRISYGSFEFDTGKLKDSVPFTSFKPKAG
jgi:hypothetical protein